MTRDITSDRDPEHRDHFVGGFVVVANIFHRLWFRHVDHPAPVVGWIGRPRRGHCGKFGGRTDKVKGGRGPPRLSPALGALDGRRRRRWGWHGGLRRHGRRHCGRGGIQDAHVHAGVLLVAVGRKVAAGNGFRGISLKTDQSVLAL